MPQFSTTTKKTKQKKELKNGCKTIDNRMSSQPIFAKCQNRPLKKT